MFLVLGASGIIDCHSYGAAVEGDGRCYSPDDELGCDSSWELKAHNFALLLFPLPRNFLVATIGPVISRIRSFRGHGASQDMQLLLAESTP